MSKYAEDEQYKTYIKKQKILNLNQKIDKGLLKVKELEKELLIYKLLDIIDLVQSLTN